jgi:hypothetical protein
MKNKLLTLPCGTTLVASDAQKLPDVQESFFHLTIEAEDNDFDFETEDGDAVRGFKVYMCVELRSLKPFIKWLTLLHDRLRKPERLKI